MLIDFLIQSSSRVRNPVNSDTSLILAEYLVTNSIADHLMVTGCSHVNVVCYHYFHIFLEHIPCAFIRLEKLKFGTVSIGNFHERGEEKLCCWLFGLKL